MTGRRRRASLPSGTALLAHGPGECIPWVTIWIGIRIKLHHRFDSSEVYLMKNFARWVLAFATVTSISGSALAIRNDCVYNVSMKTGPEEGACRSDRLPAGRAGGAPRSTMSAATWASGESWRPRAPPLPPTSSFASRRRSGTTTATGTRSTSRTGASRSCPLCRSRPAPWRSRPAPASPHGSRRRPLCNFVGMEDDFTGTIKATLQFYSSLSMPVPVTSRPALLLTACL